MKRCSHCKIEKPLSEFNRNRRMKDGYQNCCKSCHRIYIRDWEARHTKERKTYLAQWHVSNLDRRRAQNNANDRQRYHSDPQYRQKKNRQKSEQIQRKYQTDPAWVEKYRMWNRNHSRHRRVLASNSAGSHTEAEWLALCEHYQHKCAACHQNRKLTRDHVIPLSMGGSDAIDNIQPLCGKCNSKKHTKTVDYRKGERGRR